MVNILQTTSSSRWKNKALLWLITGNIILLPSSASQKINLFHLCLNKSFTETGDKSTLAVHGSTDYWMIYQGHPCNYRGSRLPFSVKGNLKGNMVLLVSEIRKYKRWQEIISKFKFPNVFMYIINIYSKD